MNKAIEIQLLATLEAYRLHVLEDNVQQDTEFTVRICEAIVAMAMGYGNRADWTDMLDGLVNYCSIIDKQEQYTAMHRLLDRSVKEQDFGSVIWEIYRQKELDFVMEDVRNELTDSCDGEEYDKEKYPEEAVRTIAENVIRHRDNSDSIADIYCGIIRCAIGDYDDGEIKGE